MIPFCHQHWERFGITSNNNLDTSCIQPLVSSIMENLNPAPFVGMEDNSETTSSIATSTTSNTADAASTTSANNENTDIQMEELKDVTKQQELPVQDHTVPVVTNIEESEVLPENILVIGKEGQNQAQFTQVCLVLVEYKLLLTIYTCII